MSFSLSLERMTGAMLLEAYVSESVRLGVSPGVALSGGLEFVASVSRIDLSGIDCRIVGRIGARNSFRKGRLGDLEKFRDSLHPNLRQILTLN